MSYKKISNKQKRRVLFVVFIGFISWLCFSSLWGLLSGIFIYPVWKRLWNKEEEKKRQLRTEKEWKTFMESCVAALQIGYAPENAMREARKELEMIYGEESVIGPKVEKLNQAIERNISFERAFSKFTEEIGLEEGEQFGRILILGKRKGGDYVKFLRNALQQMQEKFEVRQEIASMIAEKQLEFRIMSGMPFFILLYVKITAGDMVSLLYHNLIGVVLMILFLLIYAVCFLLGQKILETRF